MNKFANSIAVVTGASSGIGKTKHVFFSTVLLTSRTTHFSYFQAEGLLLNW